MPQTLNDYLNALSMEAGAPSRRTLANLSHLGKSTVSAAFSADAVPTWPVTEALTKALGGNTDTARKLWSGAKSTAAPRQQAPTWLTQVRTTWPAIVASRDVEEAGPLALSDPSAGVSSAWEALRVATLQISAEYFDAIPGSWSSDVLATLRRAEDEGHLPTGVTEAATQVHRLYVPSMSANASLPFGALMQAIVLGYRVAWTVWETIHPETEVTAAS